MKKIWLILCIMAILLSVTACTKDADDNTVAPETMESTDAIDESSSITADDAGDSQTANHAEDSEVDEADVDRDLQDASSTSAPDVEQQSKAEDSTLATEDEPIVKRITRVDLEPDAVQEWFDTVKDNDSIACTTTGGYHYIYCNVDGAGGFQPEIVENTCTIQIKDLSGGTSFVLLSVPDSYALDVQYKDQHAVYPS